MDNYSFNDFRDIISKLRSENGCPWDREQTYDSLKPCMIEEAAEYVASVRIYKKTGDYSNMCEELGDVMLQVMLNSQIAEEEGLFTVDDVLDGISKKMIRRHPHVFGDVEVNNSKEVLANWEDIKKEEKAEQTWHVSELRDIPVELPALVRGQKVIKKAKKLYKASKTEEESINAIDAQISALKADNEDTNYKIIGQLLKECVNLAMLKGVNAEQALTDTIEELIDGLE